MTVKNVRHAHLIITMTTKYPDAIVALCQDAPAKTHSMAEHAAGYAEDVVDAYGRSMALYERLFTQTS